MVSCKSKPRAWKDQNHLGSALIILGNIAVAPSNSFPPQRHRNLDDPVGRCRVQRCLAPFFNVRKAQRLESLSHPHITPFQPVLGEYSIPRHIAVLKSVKDEGQRKDGRYFVQDQERGQMRRRLRPQKCFVALEIRQSRFIGRRYRSIARSRLRRVGPC